MNPRRLTQSQASLRFLERKLVMIGEYKGVMIPVLVECMECGHRYESSINLIHKIGRGCQKCGGTKKLTQKEVSDRCAVRGLELIGDYKNSATPVIVRCLKCSCDWCALPYRIFGGRGCPDCADKAGHEKLKLSRSEVDSRFLKSGAVIIGEYVNMSTPVLTRCLSCDHEWHPFPHAITSGSSCPRCSPFGFNLDNPAILYYIKIHNPYGSPVFKIGVTGKTVHKRFGREMNVIEILKVQNFSRGEDAYNEEQRILREHVSHLYTGPSILRFTGITEMFSVDILGLDLNPVHVV